MENGIKQIDGNWDLGFALDKHKIRSIYTGDNAYGHPQFDTLRTEVGEALFQLKYRNDWKQSPLLAAELAANIFPRFDKVGLVIPMPPSIIRAKQPVTELANQLGKIVEVPVFDNILSKIKIVPQLKDLTNKADKIEALKGCFSVNDSIDGQGPWNALLIDDLFATGASLEMACAALRGYNKINKIYVATFTWI